MPMKLKVGLSRKVGQPNFGSLGASCDLELELDGSILYTDPEALNDKIRSAYAACEKSVAEELTRLSHHDSAVNGEGLGHCSAPANGDTTLHEDGLPQHSCCGSNDTERARYGSLRQATMSQIRALHAIANRQGLILSDILRDRFRVSRAENLSVVQASRLIDELN